MQATQGRKLKANMNKDGFMVRMLWVLLCNELDQCVKLPMMADQSRS